MLDQLEENVVSYFSNKALFFFPCPIAIENNKIASPYLLQAQLEKSYIAHSALHLVLENMDLPPALLPSLPSLLLLGYRKSIALLLPREISIELTMNFGNFALARSFAEKNAA